MSSVRELRVDDVDSCAGLHRRAFPEFFLSALGESFLRVFYRSFVGAADAIAVVAVSADGAVEGVVVGATAPAGFFKRLLLRRWWAFGLASLFFVLRHPRQLPRLLRALSYRGGSPLDLPGALLSSICVEPTAPAGTGQALLGAFTQRVAEAGGSSAFLVTDAVDNDRVNRFYQKAGWSLAGNYATPEGRIMNAYQWTQRQEGRSA